MFTHERHRAILELLEKKQRVPVRELQKRLKISAATLRRDLTELEESEQLVRVHGGAVHPQYFRGEPSFDQKGREAPAAKRAMGSAAAALVPEHQTVFIDAGTSCLHVGRALASRSSITLITNSPAFVQAVQDSPAKIICCGGELRSSSGALVGALALDWLGHLRADWAFIGASGLSDEEGPSTTELSEAAIKQAMIRRAGKRVLVADSGKWQHPVTTRFAGWEDFDVWVTDDQFPAALARRLAERGLRIVRAPARVAKKAAAP
jgi:DeoR/GlpR family transcriptional regulator of sugar metabolism